MHCSVRSPKICLSEAQRRIVETHAFGIARAFDANCSTLQCACRVRSEHPLCIDAQRLYVHWHDAGMPYTYGDSNYEVRAMGWETFLTWLKDRIGQNA